MVAGCSVGPDFTPPKAETPAGFTDPAAKGAGVQGASRATSQSNPDPRWWTTFHDPQLTSLVERAVRGNLDLQQAVFRIVEARENEATALAAGLPTFSANGTYTREQLGVKGFLQSSGASNELGSLSSSSSSASSGIAGGLGRLTNPLDLFQNGFDASWELDLFGRVRRNVEEEGAQVEAQIESRNDALVSLEAEVAQNYIQLRGAQAEAAMARDNIRAEQDIVQFTHQRQVQGLTTDLDVLTATSQLRSGESELPTYEQQAIMAANRLAVLLGQSPGSLDQELTAVTPIPPLPPEVPVGLPASLARRRPDIREAEAQLHAATAAVGVSVAQLFPDVSLTGSVGTRAGRANYIARWNSLFYSVGPSISVPIFEGGRLVAAVRLSRAEQAESLLQYRKVVLNALENVENSLASYRTEQARRLSLQQSLQSAELSLTLARERYEHGLTTFIDVLNAERTLVNTREQLIQSTTMATTDLVSLYKALGGGWQDDVGTSSSNPNPQGLGSPADDTGLPPIGTVGNGGFPRDQSKLVAEPGKKGWFGRIFDGSWF